MADSTPCHLIHSFDIDLVFERLVLIPTEKSAADAALVIQRGFRTHQVSGSGQNFLSRYSLDTLSRYSVDTPSILSLSLSILSLSQRWAARPWWIDPVPSLSPPSCESLATQETARTASKTKVHGTTSGLL